MCLDSFLVSILSLATSSRLRNLSLGLGFVDVPGLVAGRDPELPFATPVDQIELRGCLWCCFWSRI